MGVGEKGEGGRVGRWGASEEGDTERGGKGEERGGQGGRERRAGGRE